MTTKTSDGSPIWRHRRVYFFSARIRSEQPTGPLVNHEWKLGFLPSWILLGATIQRKITCALLISFWASSSCRLSELPDFSWIFRALDLKIWSQWVARWGWHDVSCVITLRSFQQPCWFWWPIADTNWRVLLSSASPQVSRFPIPCSLCADKGSWPFRDTLYSKGRTCRIWSFQRML